MGGETEDLPKKESVVDDIQPEHILDNHTIEAINPDRPLAIKRIAPKLYLALSGENEENRYKVDMDNTPACECEGFYYHEMCRHIRRIEIITGKHKLPYLAKLLDIEFDENIGKYIETNIMYNPPKEE